ncbi:unnamed protein product [Rotaria sp. Silwood1]|nr:unnamed protein product [Rotaria sp. Silwood1]CAF1617595.1 unnamed protein product [Rotaria sp. Silwood1]CAF3812313.1 unnamed protein product [Rotaria sp. Silwood1]CAF4684699.1 unnamed protein product [Rotaria sp. Silwood1]
MSMRRLVTVVGATGAQGGAVVRSLLETGKYKIRALTSDVNSEKAQAVERLSDDIEMATCDISKYDDIKRAFQDSWAIYTLTDFWAQPDKPEVELQQGQLMADVAASLQIPYYIFSTLEDSNKISDGKLNIPYFTQKTQIREYIEQKHPNLKAIFVELAYYMQNWTGYFKAQKSEDGTVIFALPVDQKTTLHVVDVDDTGPVVREILNNPDKFVHQDICICGDEIPLKDLAKVFTKVTGIPAISKTPTEEEFRSILNQTPKFIQDELLDMYKLLQEYGCYEKTKDWTTGKKLTLLNTFEQWLKKSGWKGE